jgi:hypothetical protein
MWARPIARQLGLMDAIRRMKESPVIVIGVDEVRYRIEVGERSKLPDDAFPIRRLTRDEVRGLRRKLYPTSEDLLAEVARQKEEATA